jgi:hypothetical protein
VSIEAFIRIANFLFDRAAARVVDSIHHIAVHVQPHVGDIVERHGDRFQAGDRVGLKALDALKRPVKLKESVAPHKSQRQ